MLESSQEHSDLCARISVSVARAIGWVSDNLSQFSPFDGDDVYRPERAKRFTELAILFVVHASVTGDRWSPLARRAVRLFEEAAGRADYTDWALRYPADIVNYAQLCAAIAALGGDAADLRSRLQYAVDGGVLGHVERLPHRLVELHVALELAGIAHPLPSIDEIVAQSLLSGDLLTPLLSDGDIYAITHVILFACRFGLGRGAIPARLRSPATRRVILDLLVVTAQSREWDLLGELLACWESVRFDQNGVSAAAWASFFGAFRPDGAVLPWAVRNGDREAEDFHHVYHTTLVAILAGTVFP